MRPKCRNMQKQSKVCARKIDRRVEIEEKEDKKKRKEEEEKMEKKTEEVKKGKECIGKEQKAK